MKTLLIQPYADTDHTAGRFKRFLSAMPPISLAYVAAALKKAELEFEVYDDFLHGGDDASLIAYLEFSKPDIVGISCVTPNYPGVERVSRIIRHWNKDCAIVVGNIHADLFADRFITLGLADHVVHGEGEITTVELIRALEKRADLSQVKGITTRIEGQPFSTPSRPLIEDLDSLPFPAWEDFPIHDYELFSFARLKTPATLVLGSRGCPYKCSYCSLKIMGTTRRKRSVANLADEFEYMHETLGIKQMAFVDPIFPINGKEAIAFQYEIEKRGLQKRMVWTTETRVDLMKKDTAEAMYAAGCRRVMFGFETGSDETLQAIEKRTNLDRAREAVQITRAAKMEIIGFFMLGVPGDSDRTMNQTIDFSRELDIDFAKYTIFVPYPGTDIYNDLIKKGAIENADDWARYTSYPSKEIPAIYTVEGITSDELVTMQKKAFRSFYLRPGMIIRHLFKLRTFKLGEMFTGLRLIFGVHNRPAHNILD